MPVTWWPQALAKRAGSLRAKAKRKQTRGRKCICNVQIGKRRHMALCRLTRMSSTWVAPNARGRRLAMPRTRPAHGASSRSVLHAQHSRLVDLPQDTFIFAGGTWALPRRRGIDGAPSLTCVAVAAPEACQPGHVRPWNDTTAGLIPMQCQIMSAPLLGCQQARCAAGDSRQSEVKRAV